MHRYSSFFLTASLACLLLSSCATVKDDGEDEKSNIESAAWPEEMKKRQQIRSWEIRGRLGVQTKDTGGSMDLIWQQSGDDFTIRLLAPMGAGNYFIQGEKDGAEIRFPDGTKKRVDNTEDIFEYVLDVKLPASAVRDWIRGLPARGLPTESIVWNNKGLIDRIKQSGWNIEMRKYSGEKILLPHAMYLSREDDSELSIRLLLRQWLLDN
jgi:outer membrane lipoprotein LolB